MIVRGLAIVTLSLLTYCSYGQTATAPSTSATDHKVKIEKTKRARGTSPRKDHEVRFADKNKKKAVGVKEREPVVYKNKKAVGVKEREPVVYKNNKKMQRRNRQRMNTGKPGKKRRTPLPDLD